MENNKSNNEKQKISIEDLIQKKGITPKNLIQMDKSNLKELKEIFKEFKCTKCLSNLIINIERKKDDNILYITMNCKNNHKEIKQLSRFLKENKFTIQNDFIFYDLVPSDTRTIENDPNKIKISKLNLYQSFRNIQDVVFIEDEYYLICFKCKKIFNLKESLLEQINHNHFLFEYDILSKAMDEDGKNEKHFFLNKDIDYLEKKIKKEEEYYNTLYKLLFQNKIIDKYITHLKQIEIEIYFFKYIFELYKNNKTTRFFTNITNIYNHNIIRFNLENKDKKMNYKLEKEIENLNNELLSIYSLNTFNNKKKVRLSDYEQHLIEPPGSVFVSTSLDKPYFATGGLGLYVYKIGKNTEKKEGKEHKIDFISKINNINVCTMIYLDNKKLIAGGNKGLLLIKYSEDFKEYNIIFHINKNQEINNIIKTYDNYFLSLENNKYIIKWLLNKEENNINKIFCLYDDKGINNICDLNNKYFAYQTQEFIHIMNHKTFKNHLKINCKLFNFHGNAISKITDEIFVATSSDHYQLDFFDIETGKKIHEIIDENDTFDGILRSKREKENIEIITLHEHVAYQNSYGFCGDYKYTNNKWEKISITSDRWYGCIRHFFEMNDNNILVSAQERLYVLLYPQ